ncbi:acyl-CoA desaturase [Marinitenerispora sediminis]|uniref:Acyl-CoA desaturase n=1 Tax=Marinitenerispora sediminis TaxID=1931232 RepID=A0A368TBD1_9ACTN|nr:acyl-CoA desaturase [Marinitenerispora sediminis]RCV51228.1 acyl-CoA desaturase [Marinitenerispora sediminis]RCV57132.1 acyl-CoA desaturase [Marinitenerispora sediminis]RCV62179.1 acyl-CoA desaturase [Marinitenerispora sediminis]
MTAELTLNSTKPAPEPELDPQGRGKAERVTVFFFVLVPLLALLAAVPFAWGWGLTWTDIAIGAVFYVIGGLGITVGFHRHFTHGSFKANRPLRIALALAGSLAIEGGVIKWVADHRRHHKYSDHEGDPHSPWRFGDDWRSVAKGLFYAHMAWMFLSDEKTSPKRFAPDLLRDRDIVRIDRWFGAIVVFSLLAPAVIGGLVTMSWWGAFTAFFWGGLVRVALLHHVTWSVNSICHTIGEENFEVRDRSRNVWWLAIPSFGESWHNLHHADPTCARHGVLKGQIDISARAIWVFEKLGWASKVRWPNAERLAAKRVTG